MNNQVALVTSINCITKSFLNKSLCLFHLPLTPSSIFIKMKKKKCSRRGSNPRLHLLITSGEEQTNKQENKGMATQVHLIAIKENKATDDVDLQPLLGKSKQVLNHTHAGRAAPRRTRRTRSTTQDMHNTRSITQHHATIRNITQHEHMQDTSSTSHHHTPLSPFHFSSFIFHLSSFIFPLPSSLLPLLMLVNQDMLSLFYSSTDYPVRCAALLHVLCHDLPYFLSYAPPIREERQKKRRKKRGREGDAYLYLYRLPIEERLKVLSDFTHEHYRVWIYGRVCLSSHFFTPLCILFLSSHLHHSLITSLFLNRTPRC